MTKEWNPWENNTRYELNDSLVCWNPPGDGNCMLAAFSEGVKPLCMVTPEELRKIAADEILNLENLWFIALLDVYRREQIEKKFVGKWNPQACRTRRELADAVLLPVKSGNGFDFQGDAIILDLLSKHFSLDVVVYEKKYGEKYLRRTNSGSASDENPNKFLFTIFLYYTDGGNHLSKHYQLLGVDKGKNKGIQSIFEKPFIPSVFNLLDSIILSLSTNRK